MGFDQGLAERVRAQLAGIPGLTERKRFGGVPFLVDDNLCVGVLGDELIARVGPAATEAALARPGQPDIEELLVTNQAGGGQPELVEDPDAR
jgi:hypothetical protein